MDLGLADRVIVVTGASSGLGLATARALAGDGARLVLAARDPERLETARGGLAGLAPGGADALDAVALDVTGPDAADRLHARALERFGRVDGVLVNAAGPPPTSVRDSTDEQWAHAVETLFLGSVRLLRTFATRLPAGGAIAVVLSVSVRQPIPALGISNGLRPGLAGVIKSLAEEVGPDGVRVNGLLPGWTRTPRAESVDAADPDGAAARRGAIPLGRYGEPEEFGRAAAFLLSPAASYVTGAFLPVDGGVIRGL